MTLEEAILEKVRVLPIKKQQEILKLAESFAQEVEAAQEQNQMDWKNDPFVGMWKDREDMADSTEWVRQLRRRE
jgi:hypothetical protein